MTCAPCSQHGWLNSFNSTKVRLWPCGAWCPTALCLFQFYKSAIMTLILYSYSVNLYFVSILQKCDYDEYRGMTVSLLVERFNSTKVRLWRGDGVSQDGGGVFQFYKSAIMTEGSLDYTAIQPKFQFYESAIMTRTWYKTLPLFAGFNSTKVRLWPNDSTASWHRRLRFNSTKVRLWPYALPSAVLKNMFQFYKSAIMTRPRRSGRNAQLAFQFYKSAIMTYFLWFTWFSRW